MRNSSAGHDTNVTNFEKLITACMSHAAVYNPSYASIRLSALQQKLIQSQEAHRLALLAIANHQKTTNEREILFEPLQKLCTRLVSALDSCGASQQIVDDARSILNLYRRQTQSSEEEEVLVTAEGEEENPEPVKKKRRRSSQRKFEDQISQLRSLIALLEGEPLYQPFEQAFRPQELGILVLQLQSACSSVYSSKQSMDLAVIERKKVLYEDETGLVDLALNTKKYFKALFGASADEFKKINKLKFRKLSR